MPALPRSLRLLLMASIAGALILLGWLLGASRREPPLPRLASATAPAPSASLPSSFDDLRPASSTAAPIPAATADSSPASPPPQVARSQRPAPSGIPPLVPAQLARIPAAFIDPRPEDHFDEAQLEAFQYLREQFIDSLKQGGTLDPSGPEYAARWQALQNDFDQQFRAQFGYAAFNKYRQLADDLSDRANAR